MILEHLPRVSDRFPTICASETGESESSPDLTKDDAMALSELVPELEIDGECRLIIGEAKLLLDKIQRVCDSPIASHV